jgi:hypothetical protein
LTSKIHLLVIAWNDPMHLPSTNSKSVRVAGIAIGIPAPSGFNLRCQEECTICKPMNDIDQEIYAELNQIAAEWRALEERQTTLEAAVAHWHQQLLEDADRLGLGEAIRRRTRPASAALEQQVRSPYSEATCTTNLP